MRREEREEREVKDNRIYVERERERENERDIEREGEIRNIHKHKREVT